MLELPALTIESVFGCVPACVADNLSLLTDLVGRAKAESIVQATGFATRRVAVEGQSVFDLVLPAARRALAGVAPADIGGVVAVTFSHPDRFPALAIRLQHALGLPQDVAAFDLALACSGYPYGLCVAGQLAAATGKHVLLVDGDVQSAHVDASDVNTLAVMSDAATATRVSATGGSARFAFRTDGAGADVLRCGTDGKIRMDGFGVFRFVAGPVTEFLRAFLAETGMPDFFVPHQANMYMVRQLAKSLGLSDQLLTSGEQYANPGSCSVPLTLAQSGETPFPPVCRSGETPLPQGMFHTGAAALVAAESRPHALLAGFGAGLSAAAASVELSPTCERGVLEL